MRLNYKPIGKYIRLVDERNAGLKIQTLLGLSISKEFIPSVANIIGSDMENYKIIRRNQFACSLMQVRRDKKMPVALLKEMDEAIISQAYPVFEVIDTEVLLPEYLMMWFSRPEFDREACFYAVGGVRGGLEWEDLCNMQLPVPSIEKQKDIVKEYHTIVNRITLNEQLIQKLEETAQTIYKQWFVDFEIPDDNGTPYKSSGGTMEYNSDIRKDIPKGWEVRPVGFLVKNSLGGDWGVGELDGTYNKKVLCLRGTDIPNFTNGIFDSMPERYIPDRNLKSKCLGKNHLVVEISGGSPTQSTGRSTLISEEHIKKLKHPVICSNFCRAIELTSEEYSYFLYRTFRYLYATGLVFNYENSTTGVKNFNLSSFLSEEFIPIPPKNMVIRFSRVSEVVNRNIITIGQEIEKLLRDHDMLLAYFLMGHSE